MKIQLKFIPVVSSLPGVVTLQAHSPLLSPCKKAISAAKIIIFFFTRLYLKRDIQNTIQNF